MKLRCHRFNQSWTKRMDDGLGKIVVQWWIMAIYHYSVNLKQIFLDVNPVEIAEKNNNKANRMIIRDLKKLFGDDLIGADTFKVGNASEGIIQINGTLLFNSYQPILPDYVYVRINLLDNMVYIMIRKEEHKDEYVIEVKP